MEKINQISYKFFGRELDNYFSNVIITNIRSVYVEIIKNAEVINQSRGFYECSLINLNSKKYLVIRISPGNVIIDVLKVIGKVTTNISLIGLAGTLNGKYLIGDIVCPGIAVNQDNLDKKIIFDNDIANSGLICQTDGLVQDNHFYLDLIDKGVDFVDMESFFLASFCKKNDIKSRMMLIISDAPLEHAFYESSIFLEEHFEKILDNLINFYL